MIPAVLLCCTMLAACAGMRSSQAEAAPAPPARKAFQTPEAMLDALETATRDLRDFQAQVIYDRTDAITEDRERRSGRIVLEQDGATPPRRRFTIAFDRFIDA